MTVDAWLRSAVADAERRGLPELTPLLEGLAPSLRLLRDADFTATASPRARSADDMATATPRGPTGLTSPIPHASGGAATGAPTRHVPLRTIEALGQQLRNRRLSSVEATAACLQAIDSLDASLRAFIVVLRESALDQARQADAELAGGLDRGPLHGVPVSIKDLFDMRGVATTAASRVRATDVAAHDAEAIVHLREAGAVIVGKTNLHEFAFGTTSEDSGFGAVHHPLDHTRSPGGSSGGSAVSVATGMALGTLGTDTGGSIRIPSAACGLVGLKPTAGEISADGVVPLSRTLDHVGPLAQTVTDAWLLYQALTGRQVRPLSALSAASAASAAPLDGLRVGIPRRYFCDVLEPDVRAAFESAIATLERAGARVAPVEIAHADYIAAVYLQIVFGEAAAYHAATLESMAERYTAPVRLRLELARYALAEDYLRAMAGRAVLQREVDAALSWYDVLALPTLPIAAPRLGAATVSIDGVDHPVRNLMLRLTQLFNVTGHPAISLPCGATSIGLPVGLQLVGRRHDTDGLMHIALGVERGLA